MVTKRDLALDGELLQHFPTAVVVRGLMGLVRSSTMGTL